MATDETPGAELSYGDAVAELEEILGELDNDEIDVDLLAERVRRAAELIRLCRERITGARLEIERVVLDLEADTKPAFDTEDLPEGQEQVEEHN